MNRKIKKIFIALIITFIIVLIAWFSFFNKEISNINIKTIPENCENYIIINSNKIKKEISSYFFNNPGLLIKLYDNTESIQNEFNDIDFKLNEPASIFWDQKTNIRGVYFSVNNVEDIDIKKHNLSPININDSELFINEDKNTIYYRDIINNQIRVFFSDGNINSQEIYQTFIIKSTISDTSTYNNKALDYFNKNDKCAIFRINNDYSKFIGIHELTGNIDFSPKKISILINGGVNDDFILTANDSLVEINNCWGNFSANFKKRIIKNFFPKNDPIIKNWDGRVSIGFKNLKKVGKLLSINNPYELLNHIDYSLFIGDKSTHPDDSIISSYGTFTYFQKNKESGYIINIEDNSLNINKNNYEHFRGSINFNQLYDLQNNDLYWNTIKPILMRFNLESIKMNCYPNEENKIEFKLDINSLDSTKHILFSPFIY